MLYAISRNHVLLAMDRRNLLNMDGKITESLWKNCMLENLVKIKKGFKNALTSSLSGEDKTDIMMYSIFVVYESHVQNINIVHISVT
jgi:hypothetical protein